MKKILDLRFVIGIFFLVVGLLLVGYHFIGIKSAEMSNNVNIYAGVVFCLFGLGMIALSYANRIDDDL